MPLAYCIHAILALSPITALVWSLQRPIDAAAERALIVIACLLITPFSLFYDMVIVAMPLAWMLSAWRERGFPPWSKLVLLAVLLAPLEHLLYRPLPFGLPALVLFGIFLLRLVPVPTRPHLLTWHAAHAA